MTDPVLELLAHLPDMPVAAHLGEVRALAVAHGVLVVQAPPGTGKTTLVPPALAASFTGRIVVTQPRRVAARAAAAHLAALIGESVGQSVGYSVRGEHRVGPRTRIEFVTTGVLLSRLRRDPELPGIGVLVLDEVHERHLDADLAMAFAVDVRQLLRSDLAIVAMSATLAAERTAAALAGGTALQDVPGHPSIHAAPVVTVHAPAFPLAVHWAPPPSGVARTGPRGPRPFFEHVARTARRALAEQTGDVLVFCPGVHEVQVVCRALDGVDADVVPLHGRLGARAQDAALRQGPRRRVVVATAVAESSLTVPGVRVVVDSGLAREPRTDHRRGLPGLVTLPVSQASAEQRAGRAARQGPGAVYRCWTPGENAQLRAHAEPEIRTADLTAFALDLACWGDPDGAGLALLDPPPAAALSVARATLQGLGALDEHGAVTARGRRIATVPTDPRLARALLDSAPVLGDRRAAEIVALLDDDVPAPGGDLVAALRALRREGGPAAQRWGRQAERLAAQLGVRRGEPGTPNASVLGDDLSVGLVVAMAHPGRVARRRGEGRTYLMASGTGAVLPEGSPLIGSPWLALAEVDRSRGSDATIRAAVPIDEETAIDAARGWVREVDRIEWTDGALVARHETRLGAILLGSRGITSPDPDAVAAALGAGLERDGLEALTWTPGARDLRLRLAFLHRVVGAPWPDVSDDALLADLDAWLGADLRTVRKTADVARIDVARALRRVLPWPVAAGLDELAPGQITIPTGRQAALDYAAEQPVLALRVQEAFGWRTAPRVAGGRVPVVLHLLSPAGRPAAVTADLESFWATGYPQVRAELRGRYPKHPWPEDPRTAEPTSRTRRRG
ncbi:MAG: ATP-dependent helicase HrpB [Cellulomonadaceae bacterium]